jgi:LacI family transcriptional regulator
VTTVPYKAATIIDVAREAGVSPRTVSRVVNGNDYVRQETYDRVQDVISRLGYRPSRAARSLVYDRSMIIGLAIPEVKNPYFAEVIGGVEYVAQEHGYNVLLFNAQNLAERERDIFRILEENRADGLIFNTPRLPVAELKELLQRQKAAVLIGHDPIDHSAGIVNIDILSAMNQATDHMLQAGRRNLAYVKPPNDSIYPHRQRFQGFLAALKRHQIEYNQDHIVECQPEWESSYHAIREFLQTHPEVNGLICYHDLMAFGAIEACDALGLAVPDQVAVIGFDDITFSGLNRLSLTTFKIPRFEVGVQAARMLFDRMQGLTDPGTIIIDTEFVRRNSTP